MLQLFHTGLAFLPFHLSDHAENRFLGQPLLPVFAEVLRQDGADLAQGDAAHPAAR